MSPFAAVALEARIEIGEFGLDGATDLELEAAYALLDEAERGRAAAFVFAVDRDRFVQAHAYLRRRLGDVLGVAPKDVPIVAPKDEKPVVDGRRIDFNLSHSGALAVLAVTDGPEVGIDVELLDWSQRFAEDLQGLAEHCLTPSEQELLFAAPASERVRIFFGIWTAKEARMKLTGEGFALDPKEIELEFRDRLPVAYLRPQTPAADLRFIPLSHPDAICCLAVSRERLGTIATPKRG